MGLGRLHDTGPDALPAARRHGGTDLQLVEPVHAPGRSGASSRGHHHQAAAAVGDRAQNPARRTGDADHQQHAWPARQGTPRPMSASLASWLSYEKCGAVGPAGKVVSHPQRSPSSLPARTTTSAATAPQPGMNLPWVANARNHRANIRPTAGFRVIGGDDSSRRADITFRHPDAGQRGRRERLRSWQSQPW